jgi:signal transduction histidine kinase
MGHRSPHHRWSVGTPPGRLIRKAEGVHRALARRPWLIDALIALLTAITASTLMVGERDGDLLTPQLVNVPYALLAIALILARHHRTLVLLVLSVMVTSIAGLLEGRPGLTFMAALVLLYTFSVSTSRRNAVIAGVGATAVMYLSAVIAQDSPPEGPGVIVIPAWCAAAVAIGIAVRSFRNERATEARRLQERVIDERLTIARELHDLLGHSLSVINVQTAVAAHLIRSDVDKAEEALGVARAAGRSVLDEVRGMLSLLRSDEDGAPVDSLPTIDAIDELVTTMRASGLDIVVTTHGAQRPLTRSVSLAAYRIVQESLTNALRHGTGSAWLTMRYDSTQLRLTITNSTGAGRSASTPSGHGLIGIRERVASASGSVTIEDHGDRFVVDALLPISSASAGG